MQVAMVGKVRTKWTKMPGCWINGILYLETFIEIIPASTDKPCKRRDTIWWVWFAAGIIVHCKECMAIVTIYDHCCPRTRSWNEYFRWTLLMLSSALFIPLLSLLQSLINYLLVRVWVMRALQCCMQWYHPLPRAQMNCSHNRDCQPASKYFHNWISTNWFSQAL